MLENLAAGHPVVFMEDDTPDDCVVKEYPNGRKELLRYKNGEFIVEKVLASE